MRLGWRVAWSCCVLLGSVGRAGAQDADAENRARILFEQANEAADHERFADARRYFEESLTVLARPATAFNLAQVLRSVGALRESERRLVALEAAEYGPVPDHLVRGVAQLLVQVRGEIAVLDVMVDGIDEASVRVDADEPRAVRSGARERFRIDPGQHIVIARAPDGRSLDRAIRAATGRRVAITFGFEESASPSPSVPRDEGGSLAWLAWTAGGVALVAAAIAVVVIVSAPATREPLTDPVWGQAIALDAR